MEYLIIDGYNIINAWKDVFDLKKDSLEDCRDKLCEMLSNYQGYTKINIIVVFDAHMVENGREKTETYDNLTIVYTKENETADNYIERFVYQMGSRYRVRVATSDYLEQRIVLNSGGIRMTARELRDEIEKTNRIANDALAMKSPRKNTIMSNLSPDLLEKLEKMRREKF